MTKTQYFEFDTKTSLLPDKPAKLHNLFMEFKANLTDQKITATSCSGSTYINFYPQTNKKSKPNPNPIQTQYEPKTNPNKPNFKTKIYPDFQALHVSKGTKTNPIFRTLSYLINIQMQYTIHQLNKHSLPQRRSNRSGAIIGTIFCRGWSWKRQILIQNRGRAFCGRFFRGAISSSPPPPSRCCAVF